MFYSNGVGGPAIEAFFLFSSRRRHTRSTRDWSSDVCSSDLFLVGAASLAAYGLVVNVPYWDFGKLLGVYVVLFFLLAQVVARVRFGQVPTLPVFLGGALIVAGGLIISFCGT